MCAVRIERTWATHRTNPSAMRDDGFVNDVNDNSLLLLFRHIEKLTNENADLFWAYINVCNNVKIAPICHHRSCHLAAEPNTSSRLLLTARGFRVGYAWSEITWIDTRIWHASLPVHCLHPAAIDATDAAINLSVSLLLSRFPRCYSPIHCSLWFSFASF